MTLTALQMAESGDDRQIVYSAIAAQHDARFLTWTAVVINHLIAAGLPEATATLTANNDDDGVLNCGIGPAFQLIRHPDVFITRSLAIST